MAAPLRIRLKLCALRLSHGGGRLAEFHAVLEDAGNREALASVPRCNLDVDLSPAAAAGLGLDAAIGKEFVLDLADAARIGRE